MQLQPISAESTRGQLNKILSDPSFAGAERSRVLLSFLVEQSLQQRTERLKEYTIATEALGRPDSFDPRIDPIVRAEISRLRGRLERYYSIEGVADPVEISLVRGSYVPQIGARTPALAIPPPIAEPTPIPSTPSISRLRWLLLTAIVAAVAVWGAVLLPKRPNTQERHVVTFEVAPPPGAIFTAPVTRQPFAISPDGTRLAFTVTNAAGSAIWVRDLASPDLRKVPGTEGAWGLFWSPDSRSIYFSLREILNEVNLDTGSTHSIAHLPWHVITGTWRSARSVLLNLGPAISYEVQVDTGSVRELAGLDTRQAQFLPGGERYLHVLFDLASGRLQAVVTDYRTRQSTTLLQVDSRVEYAPPEQAGQPGYLLFVRNGSLLAQRFDATRLELIGTPVPLAQNVITFSPSAAANFSASADGTLVYQSGFPLSELNWYDRAGKMVGSAVHRAPFDGQVRLSPDGTHAAAGVWNSETGGSDVWVLDRDGGEARATFSRGNHTRPVWSPGGDRMVFGASLTASPSLTVLDRVKGGEVRLLSESVLLPEAGSLQLPSDWSPDGRFILYDTSAGEAKTEIWLARASDGHAIPLLHGDVAFWGAAFSPDGRQIAFISEESGRPKVYVQGFAAEPSPRLVGEKKLASHGGGWLVRWRRDGRELYYAGLDGNLYAVPVRKEGFGASSMLFQLPGSPQPGNPTDFQFDAAPDGQSFVMTTAAQTPPPAFTVIQNWQGKLHRP